MSSSFFFNGAYEHGTDSIPFLDPSHEHIYILLAFLGIVTTP